MASWATPPLSEVGDDEEGEDENEGDRLSGDIQSSDVATADEVEGSYSLTFESLAVSLQPGDEEEEEEEEEEAAPLAPSSPPPPPPPPPPGTGLRRWCLDDRSRDRDRDRDRRCRRRLLPYSSPSLSRSNRSRPRGLLSRSRLPILGDYRYPGLGPDSKMWKDSRFWIIRSTVACTAVQLCIQP